MNIDGFEFSPFLYELHNDITNMIRPCRLFFEFGENSVPKNTHGCQYFLPNGDVKIGIRDRESGYAEDVIAHELLHVFMTLNGYPIYSTNYRDDSVGSKMGQSLECDVLHKLIIKQQKKRNLPMKKLVDKLVFDLFMNIPQISDLKFGIMHDMCRALNVMIMCDHDEFFINRLGKYNPDVLKYSNEMYECIFSHEYLNQFETRRAIIRAYKKFDEIAIKVGVPPLYLNRIIQISFIPSSRQLDLKMDQIFHFIELNDLYNLVTKADDQSSFIINKTDYDIRNIMGMCLRDFYKMKKQSCFCRDIGIIRYTSL